MRVHHRDSGRKDYELFVQAGGSREQHYSWLKPTAEEEAQWAAESPNGKIIECYFDRDWLTPVPVRLPSSHTDFAYNEQHGGWRFFRFRLDKLKPNYITIVTNIRKSIDDNVTEEQLLSYASTICEKWKHREIAIKNGVM